MEELKMHETGVRERGEQEEAVHEPGKAERTVEFLTKLRTAVGKKLEEVSEEKKGNGIKFAVASARKEVLKETIEEIEKRRDDPLKILRDKIDIENRTVEDALEGYRSRKALEEYFDVLKKLLDYAIQGDGLKA